MQQFNLKYNKMNNKWKIVIETYIMICFIGIYPKELQQAAPTIFFILGVFLYIILEIIFKLIKRIK